jgi:hypothetical protein
MAKRLPPKCKRCYRRVDEDELCICEIERRAIVATIKEERAAHIQCDDKGRAIVATCENKKEDESSSGDEEESSWEEEEEDDSSSFEELVDKPSRVMGAILDRALIEARLEQRRQALAKAVNECPNDWKSPGDSGVVAGKFSSGDDDDDSSSSLGAMNDEDLCRGCKPNLPPAPPVSNWNLPEAYRGKNSLIIEEAFDRAILDMLKDKEDCGDPPCALVVTWDMFRDPECEEEKEPELPHRLSEACRVCASFNGGRIDEEGLIRFIQAEWLAVVRKMSEDAKANNTPLTAEMIKEARAKWMQERNEKDLKEQAERYHWEPKEDPSSWLNSAVRPYIRRTYTIYDDKTGKRKYVRCHYRGDQLLDSSVVRSPIDNYHARGCKCCECNVDEDDDGTPPLVEFKGEDCMECVGDKQHTQEQEEDDDSSLSLEPRLCDAHGGDFDAVVCEKCAEEKVVQINDEDQLPKCDKHGSYNKALTGCPGCAIDAASQVRIPTINTKTGEPACATCAEADRRIEERLAERLKKEQEYQELCARIGGRILRPEPRIPCTVCDEAAFEMYTQNPDTGVRTYMKEAHEPKEHECPRKKKKEEEEKIDEDEDDDVAHAMEHFMADFPETGPPLEIECKRCRKVMKDKSHCDENDDKTREIEPARITEPGEHHDLKENDPIDVSATVRDPQIYDEMEEKQSPVEEEGPSPPVKCAKRVPFTVEHDSDRPLRNEKGELVYAWCETEQMEEGKPFIMWYRLKDFPPDVLKELRKHVEAPNTIELVAAPGTNWLKHVTWPPGVMAIADSYRDYDTCFKSDDDDSSSDDDDSEEMEKLRSARASMKQYAEEQLALYSKMAQEIETYFDEARRQYGEQCAIRKYSNPFRTQVETDKQKKEEELGFGWASGTLSPESLKKFAQQQIVAEKLLDEYAKKYPQGVAFSKAPTEDSPPKTSADDSTIPRVIKMTEPVNILCADGTVVRTELITNYETREVILVIPRSVGKTGVMNAKRVFREHGDPPSPSEETKKKMEEGADAKPTDDSDSNKRERDEEEEKEDERVKHLSRLLTANECDRQEMRGRMRFRTMPQEYVDAKEPSEKYMSALDKQHQQLEEFAKMYDEAKKKGPLPPPEYVTIFDEDDPAGFRRVHVKDLPPDLRCLYKSKTTPSEQDPLKGDDEEETKRLRREHDMQKTLDALKGKGLEKFLEHNMPVFKDPATLAGILQHMVCEIPDTFGVTEKTLTVVRVILDDDDKSFSDEIDRCLVHLMSNVHTLNHSTDALGQLRMMIYGRNDTKRVRKADDDGDINSIIGHAILREGAYERFTTAIRFVLTQAYIKGKTNFK